MSWDRCIGIIMAVLLKHVEIVRSARHMSDLATRRVNLEESWIGQRVLVLVWSCKGNELADATSEPLEYPPVFRCRNYNDVVRPYEKTKSSYYKSADTYIRG